jgi:hypothetical protein
MGQSWWRRPWPHGPLGQAIVLLSLVAAAAVLLIWLVGEPDQGTKWHEARNVSIQLLGLVVVGAFVTLATNRFQQASEARQRLDDRASDFLDELLTSYHGVKQVRRDVQSMLLSRDKAPVQLSELAPLRAQLSVHQLEFEWLAERVLLLEARVPEFKSATARAHARADAPDDADVGSECWHPGWVRADDDTGSISHHLTRVEKNLKLVIESEGPVEWGKTPGVGLFVETWHFRMCVTRHVRAVQRCIEAHLLRE